MQKGITVDTYEQAIFEHDMELFVNMYEQKLKGKTQMKLQVTIECPVCHDSIECEATLILDSEGADPPYGPPGGSRTFWSLDDYSCNWQAHANSTKNCKEIIGFVTYGEPDCIKIHPLEELLIDRITEAAIKAIPDYEESAQEYSKELSHDR